MTVATSVPYRWNIVGAHNDDLNFTLIKTGASLTNFKWMSLPYHRTYQNLTNIAGPGAEFTDNTIIDKISQWNYSTQRYENRNYVAFPFPHWENEYNIFVSPGDAIAFTIATATEYYWTPAVKGF